MSLFITVLGCLFAGLIARKIDTRAMLATPWLNGLIIYFILPCIVLTSIPDISVEPSSFFLIFAPWATYALMIPFCLWACRRMKLDLASTGAITLLCILGNTAFLGIGMVRSFLGEDAVGPAVVYDQLGSFLALCILGSVTIAICTAPSSSTPESKSRIKIGDIIKKIISFPPFIALVVAVFIPSSNNFGPFLVLMKWVGLSILPIALFVVGLQMKLSIQPEHRLPVAFALGIKLILIPLFVLIAAVSLKISQPNFNTAVFQAAMPSMVTPAIMLISANIAPRLVSSILGTGTLVAMMSLPFWAYVLNNFF